MENRFCRLCLSRENVLDVFSKELINSDQLRMYIWLCSGVNILATDIVTKYVCHTCCEISMKIYKFRKNAIANDISLKRLLHQTYNRTALDPINSNVLTLNEFLIKKPDIKIKLESNVVTDSSTSNQYKKYVIHPSIFKIMKQHPKTILPSNLITKNCDPKVHIVNLDIASSELNNMPIKLPNDLKVLEALFPDAITRNLKMKNDLSRCETEINIADNFDTSGVNSKPIEKESGQRNLKMKNDLSRSETEVNIADNFNTLDINSKPAKDESGKSLKQPQCHANIQEKVQVISDVSIIKVEEVVIQGGESMKRSFPIEENNTKRIKLNVDIASPLIPESSSTQLEHLRPNIPSANDGIKSRECIAQTAHELNKTSLSIENVISSSDSVLVNTASSSMSVMAQNMQEQPQNILTEASSVSSNTRQASLHRKSRPSFFLDDDMCDSDDDYDPNYNPNDPDNLHHSLLETVEEETTYTCHTCNKMFDKKRNLKIHRQRMHKTCIVCKKIFRSRSSLISHMKETCYDTIIKNQPVLCLERCDGMVKKASDTESDSGFEILYISDDDDEPRANNLDQKMLSPQEQEKIYTLYHKYHNAVPSFYKTSSTQENFDFFTVIMGKGQATLSDMYSILKHYRVPITLNSNDSMNVEIKKGMPELPSAQQISDWDIYPIKSIKCQAMYSKTVGRYIAPKANTPTVQNFKSANQLLKEALHLKHRSTSSTAQKTPPIILNTIPFQNQQRSQTVSDTGLKVHIPKQTSVQQNSRIPSTWINLANNTTKPGPNGTITAEISSRTNCQNQQKQSTHTVETRNVIPQSRTLTTNPSTMVHTITPQMNAVTTNPSTMFTTTHTMIPQVGTVTKNSPTVAIHQPSLIIPNQTYIHTPQGYVLSAPLFTTANLQNVQANLNLTIPSTSNQTMTNQPMTISLSNEAILGGNLNQIPPQKVTISHPGRSMPNIETPQFSSNMRPVSSTSNQSMTNQPMTISLPNEAKLGGNLNQIPPPNLTMSQAGPSMQNIKNHQFTSHMRPVSSNKSTEPSPMQKNSVQESTATQLPNGKLNYLRVKFPWELK